MEPCAVESWYCLCLPPRVWFTSLRLYFLFLIFIIYLFIWLLQVLVAACGIFSCGVQGLQLQLANSQLRHACGIQFRDQGSNPGPLHLECGVLTTGPPGKSLYPLDFKCVHVYTIFIHMFLFFFKQLGSYYIYCSIP